MDPTILSRAMMEVCYHALLGFIVGIWACFPIGVFMFVVWVLTRDNPNNPDL